MGRAAASPPSAWMGVGSARQHSAVRCRWAPPGAAGPGVGGRREERQRYGWRCRRGVCEGAGSREKGSGRGGCELVGCDAPAGPPSWWSPESRRFCGNKRETAKQWVVILVAPLSGCSPRAQCWRRWGRCSARRRRRAQCWRRRSRCGAQRGIGAWRGQREAAKATGAEGEPTWRHWRGRRRHQRDVLQAE